ncbi:ribbon-helix-helix protein, CopG family [Campylobacter sp. MIT 21-1685]|uniref:ribbon-helix-helix protein, CopG family n=1 Tax=unclassified Campylobacter TaxID=2593542 RepID=UPI00224B2959|nr:MULTISPECIES: ribbon-helix-helix protein, CopG family [unclassified Campylobacter]MCX2683858.1 ribbon-helix-helix protein, CopG family [Campylobacter sp. MIT 21-1684]MCX2752142.1 ribbon-helix-helix protein, CopG family [Campylobacter sp. MIT 21-1682]MCX2808335.1 ribbon-helix-helix protein, CopG family [Campylobacter sp. MIT 21-1685]
MKTAINIRLDKDLIQTLDYTAKEMNLTRTALIERAIIAYQDRMDEMISDKIIDEIKEGKRKTIPYDEFKKQLGWD